MPYEMRDTAEKAANLAEATKADVEARIDNLRSEKTQLSVRKMNSV